jgi:hypothetical protein
MSTMDTTTPIIGKTSDLVRRKRLPSVGTHCMIAPVYQFDNNMTEGLFEEMH